MLVVDSSVVNLSAMVSLCFQLHEYCVLVLPCKPFWLYLSYYMFFVSFLPFPSKNQYIEYRLWKQLVYSQIHIRLSCLLYILYPQTLILFYNFIIYYWHQPSCMLIPGIFMIIFVAKEGVLYFQFIFFTKVNQSLPVVINCIPSLCIPTTLLFFVFQLWHSDLLRWLFHDIINNIPKGFFKIVLGLDYGIVIQGICGNNYNISSP